MIMDHVDQIGGQSLTRQSVLSVIFFYIFSPQVFTYDPSRRFRGQYQLEHTKDLPRLTSSQTGLRCSK